MVGTRQTLFDILGVAQSATAHEIHERWLAHVKAAGGNADRIPPQVREAYSLLSVEQSREQYRTLLDYVESGNLFELGAEQYLTLLKWCDETGLHLWQNPHNGSQFVVTHDGALPPAWLQPPSDPAPSERPHPDLMREFTARRRGRWILLAASLLFSLGAAAVTNVVVNAYAERRAATDKAEFQSKARSARELFEEFTKRQADFASEFVSVTGDSPGSPTWSDEVNGLMLKHPEVERVWGECGKAYAQNADVKRMRDEVERGEQVAAGAKHPTLDDHGRLRRLTEEMSGRVGQIKGQRGNLTFLKNLIEADRSMKAGQAVSKEKESIR